MNFFLKNLFILILFFSFDAFGRMEAARKLLMRTLDGNPTKKSISQLERDIKPFIEEVYSSNRDSFLEGSVIEVIRETVGDSSLNDVNFRAILYSISMRTLIRNEDPVSPYFYLMANFVFELKNNFPSRTSELVDIISSPYFRLPFYRGDSEGYRSKIFEYISRNFRYIHERGRSRAILLKWWDQVDFRRIVFPSIQIEQLDDPDFLLKWWVEDKKMGTERIHTFTLPYFRELYRAEVIRTNDIFWQTVLDAVKNNEDFQREMNFLFAQIGKPLTDWTPGMIRGLSPEELQTISPKELGELNFEQVQAFTEKQISFFNSQQRRALFRIYSQ